MEQLLLNYEIARTERVAICQDTGMAVVFMDVGQDVHIAGDLSEAVADGVAARVSGRLPP
jgi:fumarate hydratase subunit alpha